MEIENTTVWLIMSKDRQWVAKGTPRNRYLINLSNIKDKKRYLTYTSKGRAEAGFSNGLGFYGNNNVELEAVECQLILKVV